MQIESYKWARVKELFEAALDREPTKRAAFLAKACAGDALRREVESLLAFDAGAESFIERPAYEAATELFADEGDEHEAVGRRFGTYKVIREIGRGGMGAVYLAERADDEYQKQVAIKIVKRGMDTDFVLRRFRQERQILAQLDHPHIARLLEGGTTDDGLPYFVMEYVQGIAINDYADAHKLSTLERLTLFRTVCSAVSYAHRNLVVHRDLKPSNILVTPDGVPKLLDFGIAKLLDTNAATHTMTALVAMTPEYASPEQVRGQPVTTASDVYSLGVVLYELLSGHRPFRLANRRPDEIARVVCEEEPERPSRAISDRGLQNAELKDNPQSEIHNLKFLRGDLDNIVLKAMRKEPERRYASVEQFSEDIRRHLEGLPVLARKDTFKYRAEKFIKRNKVSVAAAALVVLSLLTGVAIALTEAHRATVQARIANEQRDEAERARERAEKTSRFMQSFLSYANPNWYGRGQGRTNVTVREAIDAAAARIDTELADAPEVRADLHYTVGLVYSSHGEYELSFRHIRHSLDLYRQVHGEQHPKVARGLYYLSLGMSRMGTDIEEVKTVLRQGIVILRQTDPDNVNLPYMLQQLASWIMKSEKQNRNESRLAEAESLILESRPLFVRHYGENHLATLSADESLATLVLTRGDLARAESMREEVLRRYRQVDGEGYSHIWAVFYLAEVKLALGKGTEAETLFEQSLEMGRRQWGANDFRFERLVRDISQARAAARQ